MAKCAGIKYWALGPCNRLSKCANVCTPLPQQQYLRVGSAHSAAFLIPRLPPALPCCACCLSVYLQSALGARRPSRSLAAPCARPKSPTPASATPTAPAPASPSRRARAARPQTAASAPCCTAQCAAPMARPTPMTAPPAAMVGAGSVLDAAAAPSFGCYGFLPARAGAVSQPRASTCRSFLGSPLTAHVLLPCLCVLSAGVLVGSPGVCPTSKPTPGPTKTPAPTATPNPCGCSRASYVPVCGVDGKTYFNK